MVVDDNLGHRQRAQERSEVTELVPGAGIDHDGCVGVAVLVSQAA